MTSFIKCITSSILFLLSIPLMAQDDFQGLAVYESKTTVDFNDFGRGQLSEERKKMIKERMKSMLEKTFVLTFNKKESNYKEEEKLEAPGVGRGGRFVGMMGSFTAGPQYKNIKDKLIIQDQEFFGKQFLIRDTLQDLDWTMESDTKQIGQYMCFKATAVKKVDELDWRSMRRRNRDNDKQIDSTETSNETMDIEVPKQIIVTAWYTPQIPVSQGPAEYYGLPGLILEVNADRTTILCSKIVLNPEEKKEIKTPTKGKEVTRKEYNDIVKEKMEDMQGMFRSRRGGNFHRN